MKNITLQRYFSMLAVAIIIALVAVVLFTRNSKAVTGIKQVFNLPPIQCNSARS